jgi:hypothetical protein
MSVQFFQRDAAVLIWRRVFNAVGDIFDHRSLTKAVVALSPLMLAALASGQSIWLQVSLVTISVFIGAERARLAPLGVLMHGFAVAVGFLALVAAFEDPLLFVAGSVVLGAVSVLVTAQGSELRWVGTFTIIPVLYLAFEAADGVAPNALLGRGLHLFPYLLAAMVPVLLLAAFDHHRIRTPAVPRFRHFAKILSRTEAPPTVPYWEATIAAALGVLVTASLVEWFHIDHGQLVIWSAVSVVTGDVASARLKLRDRVVGAITGVPAGIAVGWLLPHDKIVYAAVALAALLTFVAFRRYVISFAARCACIAVAFMVVGESTISAGERIANVTLGGVIGILFVLAVHVVADRKSPRSAQSISR